VYLLDKDVYKDALKKLATKTELEKTISVALQGPPQIKLEEKRQYLGEFRERVLIALTKAQVMKSSVFPEIIETLHDKRAAKMLIHGDIDYRFRGKYQRLAAKIDKPYTVVHDPDLKGDVGLVIASDHAIDIEDIQIND
jgi:uncharacterized protein YueI